MNYAVYYLNEQENEAIAVEIESGKSAEDVDSILPPNVNWYGAKANSEKDAIAIAKANGLRYISPEKMIRMKENVAQLREISSEFFNLT